LKLKELLVINDEDKILQTTKKGQDFITGYKNDSVRSKKNRNETLRLKDLEIEISYYCTLGSLNRRKGKIVHIDPKAEIDKSGIKTLKSNTQKIGISSQNHFKILYVEDALNDQLIVKKILKKKFIKNFELHIANTGMEGIEFIKANIVNLILLDYKLPDITGLEFLDEIRKTKINAPVIFLTSEGNEKIAVQAMKQGAIDYIVKNEINSGRLIQSLKLLKTVSTPI
jgi:CheY-like chemotaxis protein